MPAFIIGAIGLAASIGGGVMGAQGQASSAKAQAQQAEINRQWQEFEKQMNLGIARGKMGIAEMDRLYRNKKIIGQSREMQLAQQRAAREQYQYTTQQFSRNFRQSADLAKSSMQSRGIGRGGTAAAISNQQIINAASDQLRMQTNFENQMDMFANQRNQALSQINARTADAPPMYIPSTPIPMPNTQGMVLGAALSGLGQGLGAFGGVLAGGRQAGDQSSASAPNNP